MYVTWEDSTVSVALEEHTDVLPPKAHRMIASYSSCTATADELTSLGAATKLAPYGGIASVPANAETERRNEAFTRAFRGNLVYLVRSAEVYNSFSCETQGTAEEDPARALGTPCDGSVEN